MTIPVEILTFWFEEIDRSLWFKKDADFDRMLAERFGALHAQASLGELSAWRDTPHGRLAEIIVLDQGRIIERGCHSTLLAQGGAYAQMWLLQQQEADTGH